MIFLSIVSQCTVELFQYSKFLETLATPDERVNDEKRANNGTAETTLETIRQTMINRLLIDVEHSPNSNNIYECKYWSKIRATIYFISNRFLF